MGDRFNMRHSEHDVTNLDMQQNARHGIKMNTANS